MKSDLKGVEAQNHLLGSEDPNPVPFLAILTGKLDKCVYLLNQITHSISMLILFLLMFLTLGDVIGRNFLNKPITGAYELTSLGLVILIFFGLGMTQIKNDHITIDFMTKKFPIKIQAGLHAFMSLILLILLLLTSWQLVEYARRLMSSNEISGDLGIPLYFFSILAAIGVFFFGLTILSEIFRSILKVVQKDES